MSSRPPEQLRPHVPVQLDGPHVPHVSWSARLVRSLAWCAIALGIAGGVFVLTSAALALGYIALTLGVV